MKFITPDQDDVFTITSVPEWPTVVFQTDAAGTHTWNWSIAWGAFVKSGKETTSGNKWDAKNVICNYGGKLTVRAEAGSATAAISVKIKGANPSSSEVCQYLASKENSAGFDKIIAQESHFLHFNTKKQPQNEPIKSFDNGYGMCQLTNPAPSFEQVWNWKMNIDCGLRLFRDKVTTATAYLSQKGRSYTPEQLKYEAVCRWNGGSYHEWDADSCKWVRHPNILCDRKTGNIGWDMNDPKNKGKTEAELRKRDCASYSRHTADSKWKYYGVCYADHILG